MRLQYVITFTELVDLSWTTVDVNIWSGLEAFIAITCAALPVLKTVFQRVFLRLLQGSRSSTAQSQPGESFLVDQSGLPSKWRIPLGSLSGEGVIGEVEQFSTSAKNAFPEDAKGDNSPRQYTQSTESRSLSESERDIFVQI